MPNNKPMIIPQTRQYVFHVYKTVNHTGDNVDFAEIVRVEVPFAGAHKVEASIGAAMAGCVVPSGSGQFDVKVVDFDVVWDNVADKTYLDIRLNGTGLGPGSNLTSVIVFGVAQGMAPEG